MIEAVQCALEGGRGGRAYFVRDRETVTFRAFIAMLAGVQGVSVESSKSISYRLAFNLGRLMEVGAAITRSEKDPPLSRSLVRMIGREASCNDSAARSELGYYGKVSHAAGIAMYSA